MKIETLEDWNNVIVGCGCCAMPECPTPVKECKSIFASVAVAGFFKPSDTNWTVYKKYSVKSDLSENTTEDYVDYTASSHEYFFFEKETNFSGSLNNGASECKVWSGDTVETCDTSGTSTFTSYKSEWNGSAFVRGDVLFTSTTNRTNLTGTTIPDTDPPETYPVCSWKDVSVTNYIDDDDGDDFTNTEFNVNHTTVYTYTDPVVVGSFTYEDPTSFEDWFSETRTTVFSEIDAADEDCWTGTSCVSSWSQSHSTSPPNGAPLSFSAVKSKFKWEIPDTFTGSYFKITWDVVTFPTTYDPEDAESPQPIVQSTDNTWVWAGPGDPEDPDSWKSDSFELPVPEANGQTRVVNVRYECYKSTRLGTRPQVLGESYAIPE